MSLTRFIFLLDFFLISLTCYEWGIIINNSEEAQVTETGELCQLSFRRQI